MSCDSIALVMSPFRIPEHVRLKRGENTFQTSGLALKCCIKVETKYFVLECKIQKACCAPALTYCASLVFVVPQGSLPYSGRSSQQFASFSCRSMVVWSCTRLMSVLPPAGQGGMKVS